MKRSRLGPALALALLLGIVGSLVMHRSPQPAPAEVPIPPAEESLRPPPAKPPPAPAAPSNETAASEPPKERPSIRISGRVENVQSAPIPYVKVDVFARDFAGTLTRLGADTDGDGAFHADVPQHTRATFTAHLAGHARGFTTVQVGAADQSLNQIRDITLTLRTPVALDGLLTGADGSPVAAAKLTFHPFATRYADEKLGVIGLNTLAGSIPPDAAWDERCRKELFLTDARAVTDGQGRFRAESLTAGVTYLIAVERDGGARVVLEAHARGQKEPVALRLPP